MKKILSILLVLTLAVFAMASTVSAANEAGTVYDVHDYFGEAETGPFTFNHLVLETGELTPLAPTTGTGKVNQYDAKGWVAYQLIGSGSALVKTTDTTVTDARFSEGKIWGELPSPFSVGIVFTAPVAGEYSFEMTATRWWGNNTSAGGTPEQQPSAITVKYGDQTKTAKLETDHLSDTVEGTVTLAAGETILFYLDPLGNGAGDNFTLNALNVTLDSVSAVTPNEPVAPDTADGIIAAIALLAVAGTAIVVARKTR